MRKSELFAEILECVAFETEITKEQILSKDKYQDVVDALLKQYGIELKKDKGYDCVYVCNMAISDYFGSSIPNQQYLAMFIKDFIDDEDAYDGMPFTRYYADTIGSGTPIPWEEMM